MSRKNTHFCHLCPMFEHLIPSHNINLYAVNGHLSFQGRFSGCALRTTEIVIPQKAWKSGDGKFYLETSSPSRPLFKLGKATAIPDDIPDSYDSKDDLSRFIFGSFQLTLACGGVHVVITEISGWSNSPKRPNRNINDLHENAWINSDLMSFSSCVFTLLNGYFEAFCMESFYIQ